MPKGIEGGKGMFGKGSTGDNENIQLFGRSYAQTGSTDSDYIIKTRGQIKIQVGKHFVDLLKDGKLNVDAKFINTVKTKDDIGVKDGLYVTDDGSVYLKVGDKIINLVGEIGDTYVSFMAKQETTSEQKETALKNVGFLYNSLEEVDENAIQNGIIYVTSEQKLYTIVDGVLSEFTFQFPNPFTQQFIVEKNDASQGAIVIKGEGINNSLAFDSLFIYVLEGDSYIDSIGDLHIKVNNEEIVTVTENKTTFNNKVESNFFQSKDATSESGFRLYVDENGSTLEVDNLIVRNKKDGINTLIFPKFWSYENNVIVKMEAYNDPENEDSTEDSNIFILSLQYKNKYKINDYLYVYGRVKEDNIFKLIQIPFKVVALDIDEFYNNVHVELIPTEETAELTEIPDVIGQYTFLASSDQKFSQLRYSKQDIDLLEYTTFEEESKKESIKSKVGNLTELEIKGKNKDSEIPIEGVGMYSENAAFLKAQYTSKYDLPYNDYSTKFVSTEWFHKLLPKGSIIMFNGGSKIPDGWALCDGTNGTPNLIDKFIKAGTSNGPSNDSNSQDYPVVLTSENTPTSSHAHVVKTMTTDNINISLPEHTHKLKWVKTTIRKRVETGDQSNAKDEHFAGVGSIYKGSEDWDAETGTGERVASTKWTGDKIVQATAISGKITLPQLTGYTDTVENEGSESGESNTLTIREPRFYSLIFIMKIV